MLKDCAMIPLRWNTMGMKIMYVIIVTVMFILIFRSGEVKDDRRPSLINNAWELINPIHEKKQAAFEHRAVVREYVERRKNLNFTYSELGKVLFLNENPPPPRNKMYKILMYKIGKFMEERHLYYFGGSRHEPFEFCPVKNCILTYNDTDFDDADAILFLLHRFNNEYNTPKDRIRPPGQRWVFTSDESPHNTFMMQSNDWYNYSGIFNWSMMYRLESDAPVPYGRVIPLAQPVIVPSNLGFQEKFELLVPHAKVKRRDVLVAVSTSNCWANKRQNYVIDLQKHIKVDVYGGCANEDLKEMCPFKGYGTECDHLSKYLFYLSFENSNCKGYVTEKVFTHAHSMGSVPIFMGVSREHFDPLMPANSSLHVDDFKNTEELAKFLLHINATFEENYLKYHEWRKHFQSLSEDGYMGSKSYHYCRLCQALNYNDEKPKVYYKEDLAVFLDPKRNCHEPTW